MKQLILAVVALVGCATFYVAYQIKSASDLHEYAIANNCTWQYQGTMYGDDRDYICK